MASSTERQKAFREKMYADGKRQVAGFVYEHQISGVVALMATLRENPDYEVCNLRDRKSGRIVRVVL
jgi:hypothetical protein